MGEFIDNVKVIINTFGYEALVPAPEAIEEFMSSSQIQ